MTKKGIMIDLSKIWLDIECPRCHYGIQIQMIDVKCEKTIFCHNCKITIELSDNEGSVHSGIDKISSSLNELENTLKKFGR
jgi:hypothetical protein